MGKRTDLKFGEMAHLFIAYNIINSWLYTRNGFRIIFLLRDSATQESIRVRDATCGEHGPCCVKNVVAPSLVRINIDNLVVLVSRKFPCFLEIDL